MTGTRERILEATIWALDTSAESGFTVDQIADAARVGKQSIYQHFGDRDGLIVAAQAEQYRRVVLTGQEILMDGLIECVTRDQYARLLLTFAAGATRDGAERRRLRIQALGSATSRPALQAEIGEAHRSSVAVLTKLFAFGERREWLSTNYSSSTLASLWFGMITGHHLSENYADEADRESINRATVDAISLMLFGETFPQYNSAESLARALASVGGNDAATSATGDTTADSKPDPTLTSA